MYAPVGGQAVDTDEYLMGKPKEADKDDNELKKVHNVSSPRQHLYISTVSPHNLKMSVLPSFPVLPFSRTHAGGHSKVLPVLLRF